MSDARLRWVLIAALLASAFLVYSQVGDHEFVPFDDDFYVVENPHLRGGLDADEVLWALTNTDDGLRIPLTWLSYLVTAEFFGLAPSGFLLGNAVLHALNGALLFLLLLRATGATWRSAIVAALFLLHPLRAESVAWASERKDVLCGFFFLLTLCSYVRYAERPTLGRYLPVPILTALAVFSKPTAVTLPFVLLLLDFWPLGRLATEPAAAVFDRSGVRRVLLDKIPLFAVSLASVLLTYAAQEASGAMSALAEIPLVFRIQNAVVAYAAYLGKAFWPVGLSVFYPYPDSIPLARLLAAGALLLGLSALALHQAKRRPYLLMGWLWYLGMLVPVIGIVAVGGQSLADRYTYLPLIGITVSAVWGASESWERFARARVALTAVGAIALLALGVGARHQVRHWRDGVALFEHALRVDERDRTSRANLGIALLRAGEVDAGVRNLAAAYDIAPADPKARRHVYLILVRTGQTSFRAGERSRAIALYRTALAIAPTSASLHHVLARALLEVGRAEEGWQHLLTARDLDPTIAAIHARIASVLAERGDGPGAVASYRTALRLESRNPNHTAALAVLLATDPDPAVRDPAAAVRIAEEALRHAEPMRLILVEALATSYAAAGRFEEAARTADSAVRLARERGLEDRARRLAAQRDQYQRGELGEGWGARKSR
jgi:tetratricopeptide (TPR) repeat protein